jgi:cob(I)alamin adenosyltransferase
MKIYTKTGDRGETGLIGGGRVSKGDPRIVAYGSVDELNSSIGINISQLRSRNGHRFSDVINTLIDIQNDLFVIGSDLADPRYPVENNHQLRHLNNTPRAQEDMVKKLEESIDRFETELDPITFFILPGGSAEAAQIHLTRTIARRIETQVIFLAKDQKINMTILSYLNRLSDLLFVIARLMNKRLGVNDIPWRTKSIEDKRMET